MRFRETPLPGAFVINLERKEDVRGFFARVFCAHEFEQRGLKPVIAQLNISYNYQVGTLRGLHTQLPPTAETKLMRCIRGSIYDVIVDLRMESPTYRQHFGIELNDDNRTMLYVPENFAHGYLTLTDNTEVIYPTGEFYTPGAERGYRYDDPAFGIIWPAPVNVISEKDANWPLFGSADS